MQPTSLLLVAALAAPSPRDLDPAATTAVPVPDTAAAPTIVTRPDADPEPAAATPADATTRTRAIAEAPPAAVAPIAPRAPDAPNTGRCLRDRGPCRRLSAGGIGLLVGGALGLGTGIAFVVLPDYPDPDAAIYDRSLHPPGAALVAAGATLVVTGVVMLVLGRRAHRRRTPGAPATARRAR